MQYIISDLSKRSAWVIDLNTYLSFRAFMRKKSITNGITVGDFVTIEQKGDDYIITSVLDRRSLLYKYDSINVRKIQYIAANIDKLYILSPIKEPKINFYILCKYIMISTMYNIPYHILITKIDITNTDNDKQVLQESIDILKFLNIEYSTLSCNSEEDIEEFRQYIKKTIFCFIGQSGTGKSTLASAICKTPLIIGQLNRLGKGVHTTSQSKAIISPGDSICIDTPGIQEISYSQIDKTEISQYFPGVSNYFGKCKFRNCNHMNTKGCLLHEHVESKIFPAKIYDIYCRTLQHKDNPYHDRVSSE